MICASIQNEPARRIVEILENVEMAEIRLDRCALTDEEISEIFSSDTALIATCRIAEVVSASRAEELLMLAIEAGARYVDLEVEAPKPMSKRIAAACCSLGTTLIRSYHNYDGTPSPEELRAIVDRCRHHDGEVVKIVTLALKETDAQTVLSLYNYYTPESIVAFCMGDSPFARQSRLECLRLGAPFSYCCPDGADPSAPGQSPYSEMYSKVYGSRKPLKIGPVRINASKSMAQRAILAAALASGESVLDGYTPCDDSASAIALARSLGAVVEECGSTVRITGIDASEGCIALERVDVGESGLLTRLMIPLAAKVSSTPTLIEGRGSLSGRILDNADSTAAALGIKLDYAGDAARVPLTVTGPLKAGFATFDGSKTSQLVSGALMALPLSGRNSTLKVRKPTSIPYIYMTMDVLRKFGIKIRSEMYGGRSLLDQEWDRCTDIVLKIKENQRYKAASFILEGDWSSAAAYLAAGAIFGQVCLEGLDTGSLQADLTMLDILMDAGASMSQIDEPTGLLTVKKSPLQGFGADLSNSPDLFPVVAVFCAFCQGRSTLAGVRRLRHKESNRADAIMEMLSSLGVAARIDGDTMTITGESLAARIMNGHLLRGGGFSSHHDHRMVMALRLAALASDEPVIIDDTACVSKSCPDFNL